MEVTEFPAERNAACQAGLQKRRAKLTSLVATVERSEDASVS